MSRRRHFIERSVEVELGRASGRCNCAKLMGAGAYAAVFEETTALR